MWTENRSPEPARPCCSAAVEVSFKSYVFDAKRRNQLYHGISASRHWNRVKTVLFLTFDTGSGRVAVWLEHGSSLFTGSGTVFAATKSHRSCVFIVDLNAPF